MSGMTKPFERATRRPAEFRRPDHWTNDPAPQPEPIRTDGDPEEVDPTRFGDWTVKGIAIDF